MTLADALSGDKIARTVRKAKSAVGKNIWQIGLFLIFPILPITIVSGLVTKDANGHSLGLDNIYNFIKSGEWIRSFIIVNTSILISVFLIYAITKKEHQQLFQILRGKSGRGVMSVLAISLIFGTLISLVSAWGNFEFLKTQPGGMFDIFIGIISVAGIYITFGQVLDVHNSIVSFKDFLNRVEDLILDTDGDDSISMLVWTPAMGSLALPENTWQRVWKLIHDTDHNITLTCLNMEEMKLWFESYLKDCDASQKEEKARRIEKGLLFSEMAIDSLQGRARASVLERDNPDHKFVQPPVTGNISQLPQTYMVANKVRAIVAVPLFLPTPTYNPYTQQQMSNNVQFIGFETKNYHLVESVHEEIRARRAFLMDAGSGTTNAAAIP